MLLIIKIMIETVSSLENLYRTSICPLFDTCYAAGHKKAKILPAISE